MLNFNMYMHFRFFLRLMYSIGGTFGCRYNFKYFFGVLEIPDIFFFWGGGER